MNTFEHGLERLDRFIWYMARRWDGSINSMDAHDLHQTGLIKLYDLSRDKRYNYKPSADFDAIFKRVFFNALVDMANKSTMERSVIVHVDLSDISEASYTYDAFEESYLSFYQSHLEQFISADAAILLEHLLNPTPAIYHMHNIQRMRREALRSQGFRVHIPVKLTQIIVGQTLGFSVNKTNLLLKELRRAWDKVCQTSRLRQNEVML